MKKLWTGLAFWVLAALASLFLGAAAPFFLLTLRYSGDKLVEAILNGVKIK